MMKTFAPILLVVLAPTASAAERPNILRIMADDLGAENLACYGNSVYSTRILTPLLPRCGPTS
ncbi:MAG: hypothetical protein H8E44_25080 [Planctomycetes bacterium]|nr:hypothetical protein [Planctomycetota bacterium]MBL7041386.1 hypothetical protein [Pirellulaceae bacterium]